MNHQPTKEVVREWLQQRQAHREPPPSIEQIQRELGWTVEENVSAGKKELQLLTA